jgi:hypothetical protein
VALLFIFLAWLLMSINASSAIGALDKSISDRQSELAKPVKTKGEVSAMEAQKTKVDNQRARLWYDNYARQEEANLFAWPVSKNVGLNRLSDLKMKFGSGFITNNTELQPEVILNTFTDGYTNIAEQMAPTRFPNNNWRSVLRHVSDWGTKTTVEVPWLWLALEDFWIQRAVLMPIKEFNTQAATFVDVTPAEEAAKNPLKRVFRNRIWELELEVTETAGKRAIRGKIRNLTSRLQVLGMNKSMLVHIWFNEVNSDLRDYELTVRGDSVIGSGELDIPSVPLNLTMDVTKFAKVMQVFDESTVPVKLVTAFEIGKVDHKNRSAKLMQPAHIEKLLEAESAAAAESGATTGSGMGDGFGSSGGMPGMMGPGSPMAGGPDGEGGMMGPGGPFGARGAATGAKSGLWTAVLKPSKDRYIKRTEDVRRIPVALAVVVNNSCVSDVMVAFANSPIRFQITQVQWQRYRTPLPPVVDDDGPGSFIPSGGPGGVPPGMPGMPGSPGGMRPGMPGVPGGTGGGFPPGRDGDEEEGMGGSGSPGGVFPGGGNLLQQTGGKKLPDEANAGLCELGIFGILSFYEKGQKPEAIPEQPTDPALPTEPVTPTEPINPTPPMPNEPMNPDNPQQPATPPTEPKNPGEPEQPSDPGK